MFLCHQTPETLLFGLKRRIDLMLFSSCPLRGNRDQFAFDLNTPYRQILFSLISKHIMLRKYAVEKRSSPEEKQSGTDAFSF